MCRLFGLHAGSPVRATFWLLNAPDSLSQQSHREPDGTGIGTFDADGRPLIDKAPIAAWRDRAFATDARTLTSTVFVAHVRYASTGGLTTANTHPFTQDGRIFAHNGGFTGLDQLDARLADSGADELVHGDTDSERMFALITAETRARGGDVEAGITAALRWLAATVPVHSLNLILATPEQLWAVRFPETNELYVLPRATTPDRGPLDAVSSRIRAHSPELAGRAATVIASEPMDDDPRWRLVDSGEMLRIDPDQSVHTSRPF